MTKPDQKRVRMGTAGFTLAEMLVASVLLGLAIAAALTSYLYVQRNNRIQSVQSELDIDSRLAVERLRRDLWRTSRDTILLYPPGSGPYTAISFPLIENLEPNTPVPKDENGMILWDSTIVYHFWEGETPELRVTTFSPRASLSDELRVEQLGDVVRQGNGENTHNGPNASTRTVIRNLVDWELNIIRSRFDAYTPEPDRQNKVNLGFALLSDGPQRYTFRIAARNPESSGHTIGIDALTVSPTSARREAEAQFPLYSVNGGTPEVVYLPDGTWSGNYRLDFSADGIGSELTLSLDHDRWEERNFLATGVNLEETEIEFDTDLVPHSFVVHLVGNDKVWEASAQTGDDIGAGQEASEMTRAAVRVLLRGSQLVPGNFLNFNGQNAWIGFRSAGADEGQRLRILYAFIAEADPTNPMNYIPGTRRDILVNDNYTFIVSGRRESDKVSIAIDRDKNYLISFLVSGWTSYGNAWAWTPPAGGAPSSYLVPATSGPDIWTLLNSNWSSRADLVSSASVFGVEYVHAGHPSEGWYTSPVFDTHVDNPNFRTVSWNADIPDASLLELRIRSGNEKDLSGAPAWDSLSALTSGQALSIQGRYVQVQAYLKPGTDNRSTPRLKDFTLDWEGETKLVDIIAAFSTGPDHGVIELLVNGTPLFQGVTVDLTVYKDILLGRGDAPKRLTSSVLTEMIPRNTGK